MLRKPLLKVDKFYFIFALAVVAVGVLVVFTFQSIFSAIRNSFDIESQVTESDLRINKDNLDKALNAFDNRTIVPLEVR